MASFGQRFSIDSLPQREGNDFAPVPAGWYSAYITSADIKKTKAGTGEYLALRFDISGPTNAGRVVFTNINIENPNPTAERIGREQLRNIMSAAGVDNVEDSDQLVGLGMQIKVKIRSDEKYGEGNEIDGYKSLDGGSPMASAPKAAPQSNGKAAPPWSKK